MDEHSPDVLWRQRVSLQLQQGLSIVIAAVGHAVLWRQCGGLSAIGCCRGTAQQHRVVLEAAYRVTIPSQLRWQPRIDVVDKRGQEAPRSEPRRIGADMRGGGEGEAEALWPTFSSLAVGDEATSVHLQVVFGSCVKRIDADEAGGRCCFFVSEPELRHCLSPVFPLPSRVRHCLSPVCSTAFAGETAVCFSSRLSSRAPEPRPGLSG